MDGWIYDETESTLAYEASCDTIQSILPLLFRVKFHGNKGLGELWNRPKIIQPFHWWSQYPELIWILSSIQRKNRLYMYTKELVVNQKTRRRRCCKYHSNAMLYLLTVDFFVLVWCRNSGNVPYVDEIVLSLCTHMGTLDPIMILILQVARPLIRISMGPDDKYM